MQAQQQIDEESYNTVDQVVKLLQQMFNSESVGACTKKIQKQSQNTQFIGILIKILKDNTIKKQIRQAALVGICNRIRTNNQKQDVLQIPTHTLDSYNTTEQSKCNRNIINTMIKQNILEIAYGCLNQYLIPLIVNVVVRLTNKMNKVQLRSFAQSIRISAISASTRHLSYNSQMNNQLDYVIWIQYVYCRICEGILQQYSTSITQFYKNIISVCTILPQIVQILTTQINRIRQSISISNKNSTNIEILIRTINGGLRVLTFVFKGLRKLYQYVTKYLHDILLILLYLLDNINPIYQQLIKQTQNSMNYHIQVLHLCLSILYRFYQFTYNYQQDNREKAQQTTTTNQQQIIGRIVDSEYSKLIVINLSNIIQSHHIGQQSISTSDICLSQDISKCLYWIMKVHHQLKLLILDNSVNILIALLHNYTLSQDQSQVCDGSYRTQIDQKRQGLIQLISQLLQQPNTTIRQQILQAANPILSISVPNTELSMYIISKIPNPFHINILDMVQLIVKILHINVNDEQSQRPLVTLLKIRACEVLETIIGYCIDDKLIQNIHNVLLSIILNTINKITTNQEISALQLIQSSTKTLLSLQTKNKTKAHMQQINIQLSNQYQQLIIKLISIVPKLQHSEYFVSILGRVGQFIHQLEYRCLRQVLQYICCRIWDIYWMQVQALCTQKQIQYHNNQFDSNISKPIHQECSEIIIQCLQKIVEQQNISQLQYHIIWIAQLLKTISSNGVIRTVQECSLIETYCSMFSEVVYLLVIACASNIDICPIKCISEQINYMIGLCFRTIKQMKGDEVIPKQQQLEQVLQGIIGQQFVFDGSLQIGEQNKHSNKENKQQLIISNKIISILIKTLSNSIIISNIINNSSLQLNHYYVQKQLQTYSLCNSFVGLVFCTSSTTDIKYIDNLVFNYEENWIFFQSILLFIYLRIMSPMMVNSILKWAMQQINSCNHMNIIQQKNNINQYYYPLIHLSIARYPFHLQFQFKTHIQNIKITFVQCFAGQPNGHASIYAQKKFPVKWLIQASYAFIRILLGSGDYYCISAAQLIRQLLKNYVINHKKQQKQANYQPKLHFKLIKTKKKSLITYQQLQKNYCNLTGNFYNDIIQFLQKQEEQQQHRSKGSKEIR